VSGWGCSSSSSRRDGLVPTVGWGEEGDGVGGLVWSCCLLCWGEGGGDLVCVGGGTLYVACCGHSALPQDNDIWGGSGDMS